MRQPSLIDSPTLPVMFDDITDTEYAEWEDWFDQGHHNLLAAIVLIVLSLFMMAGALQEAAADKKVIKPASGKSDATTAVLHGGRLNVSYNGDDVFEAAPASSVSENFDGFEPK